MDNGNDLQFKSQAIFIWPETLHAVVEDVHINGNILISYSYITAGVKYLRV